MAEIHLRVVGKVQGVGFRWFVCEKAAALGVAGWVRNTADGDVEVVARGDSDRLAELASAVERGPKGSRVTAIHREPPVAGTSYHTPFRIER